MEMALPLPSRAVGVRPERRLAGDYVVESYAALKSLAACPDNGNAACDFSGKVIIIRCNGQTLDAKEAGRIFYGRGSGSSLEVHGCVLTRGQANVSVVLRSKRRASCLTCVPLFVTG